MVVFFAQSFFVEIYAFAVNINDPIVYLDTTETKIMVTIIDDEVSIQPADDSSGEGVKKPASLRAEREKGLYRSYPPFFWNKHKLRRISSELLSD